jgi:UDP-N-acetylglucosamine 2-epimerase (non-hydrolysing)
MKPMTNVDLNKLPDGSIAVVFGTRPEIIKLAPVIEALGDKVRLIHTGQHYDRLLSDQIAAGLGIRSPDIEIGAGGKTRAGQISAVLDGLDERLRGFKAVLVQGDTNSALAAANAQEVFLAHVEAGLRSFDRRMPEEHNRVLIDHVADLCWAPTKVNQQNLLNEGLENSRIDVTGNTVVDALISIRPTSDARKRIAEKHAVEPRKYILATLHRPENVDNPKRLEELLGVLASLPLPTVLSLHPRTASRLSEFGLEPESESLRVIHALDYVEFLALLEESALAVSDSGGVQEEVSVLKVPVIVVRRSTERPEVVGSFAIRVDSAEDIQREAQAIVSEGPAVYERLQQVRSPYGEGQSAVRIIDSLLSRL